MSESLSSAAKRDLRKELVRLRLEMHRQQLRYHAQPLTRPLQTLRSGASGATVRTPLMVAGGVLLTLFGNRLGKVGRVARAALLLYPVVRGIQQARAENDGQP